MPDKIQWGIISTGNIARKFASALKILPDANLLAVASRAHNSAQSFAKAFDVPRAYDSYEALADDPDIHAVYIATPHTLHHKNSIMCMRRGKAVLCEKAFAINAREAREMVSVAREEGVFLTEAMITRHVPLLKKVMQWVREGRIGEVRMVRASRCSRGEFPPGARHLNPALGGGSLLDVGVYPISFAFQVFGKPPVASNGLGHIGPEGSDEQGVALLQYDRGEIADLSFALRTNAVDEAYIFGTDGYIKIFDRFAVPTKAVLVQDEKVVDTIEEAIVGNALNYEAAEVMRCMREGLRESLYMPLEESVQIMEVMDTIRAGWGLRYPNDR